MERIRKFVVWLSAIIVIAFVGGAIYILITELNLQFKILWITALGLLATVVFSKLQIFQTSNIANRQEKQSEVIAAQQHYRDAIGFLSSGSPAVRRKGVEDLYEYAKQNDTKAKEVWKILNDHVKYFTRDKSYQESFPDEPAGDIELILKIQSSTNKYINKEDYPFKNVRKNIGIDWDSAWLRGAYLQEAQLQGASLNQAELQGANLINAQMQEANLYRTQMQVAHLIDTQMQGTNLWLAQLQAANLCQAQLQGANLSESQLQGVMLWVAQLQGANLSKAQLQKANLCGTQLQGADLDQAQLQGATLSKTQLQGIFSSREVRLKYESNAQRFEYVISAQVKRGTEVDSVIFEGGITKGLLSEIKEKMNLNAEFWETNELTKGCKEQLLPLLETLGKEHSGAAVRGEDIPKINEYLESRGAVHGEYATDEAKQWIAEYKKALGFEE